MEVVVTEEKKKIFRARKTMKISDRQQLESLHSTLLTTPSAPSALSDTSQPPIMNGTHKEDEQKVADKEQSNVSDSNSPSSTSPASLTSLSSPAPFLSLNLSPSPASSQSPKAKDDTSPTSPFHSLNIELKKMQEEDGKEEEEKDSSKPRTNKAVSPPPSESKENLTKDTKVNQQKGKKEADQSTTKDPAVELAKDSVKDLVSCSSVPRPDIDSAEPMETDNAIEKDKGPEASKAKIKDEKPSTAKSTTSSQSCPSSSQLASSSSVDLKQEKDFKIKEEKREKEDAKKGSINEIKIEVDSVKLKTKTEKMEARKPSRPSSTPPSDTVKENKASTPGLKRTLSEGNEKDEPDVKRELKRPKVEREELEAELELKITAKAGSHHKLEKIVQQLVDKQLRALQVTIFDKHFKELKDRVDKIDCSVKHQTAINTLQAKIARLAKKFGEANQATENKKKQEAVAAAAVVAKTATVPINAQVQRVLRRQAVEPQPEVPSKRVAPSVGKPPALPVKDKDEEKMEEEECRNRLRNIAMANKLAETSEGKCIADIKLRTITSHLEKVIYHNSQRPSGVARPDRYASYIFRYLVPYDVYCEWVAKVNYVGLLGKEALPTNLRKAMRMYIEQRFPELSYDNWREIRDAINEILRVKRRPEFFREYDKKTAVSF